jgi:hypothetical protein
VHAFTLPTFAPAKLEVPLPIVPVVIGTPAGHGIDDYLDVGARKLRANISALVRHRGGGQPIQMMLAGLILVKRGDASREKIHHRGQVSGTPGNRGDRGDPHGLLLFRGRGLLVLEPKRLVAGPVEQSVFDTALATRESVGAGPGVSFRLIPHITRKNEIVI